MPLTRLGLSLWWPATLILWCGLFYPRLGGAAVWISEVLFNPPGSDTPNAYVELGGTPNYKLPVGTYFVAVNGATNADPGGIENVFDLSGRSLGGNGLLVLLQKTNFYAPASNATVLVNTGSGPGFGSGNSSSIGHRGENGRTDLKHASVTFFLVQSPLPPTPGNDIDPNNDGVPDGPDFGLWTVLDSVGAVDLAGEFAYGAVNFRRTAGGVAGGVVTTVGFTPSYLGRVGTPANASDTAWIAGDNLFSGPPTWYLGGTSKTYPITYAGKPLDHVGAPNFGAPSVPGLVFLQTGWSTDVTEGAGTDSYALGLNTLPTGRVIVQLGTTDPLQFSTDGGISWGTNRALIFSNSTPRNVLVRAWHDNVLDSSPHVVCLRHTITNSADPARYPAFAPPADLWVNVWENDRLLLNELKVDPPDTNDAPCEFVELRGRPNTTLTNLYFVAVDGEGGRNPGKLELVINLSGATLGANGLLMLMAPDAPYLLPVETGRFLDARFSRPGGALSNDSVSFLLVSSATPLTEGTDLDRGDNGALEGLAYGATVLDSVGWSRGGPNDVVYGGADLTLPGNTPDAATRYPGREASSDPEAWFYGELQGDLGASLVYQNENVSPDFPYNTLLTPGVANDTAPLITPVDDLCGTVGDPTNPQVTFLVDDAETGPDAILVSAYSSNPAVVANSNLLITVLPGGVRLLTLVPTGVGYATITLTASDGHMYSQASFAYAASADERGGGRFHTGTSDASAAFAVDRDYMFVGDDENEVLRLFLRDQSGPPINQFDLTPPLELWDQTGGVMREVDIESCIRVGQRIFWLGSLSTSWIGNVRVNRSRIFATDLVGTGQQAMLTYAGRYDGLKEDILAWDANNLHGKGANYYGLVASAAQGVDPKLPDGSGLTIEGACLAPGSSTAAYLGFRAPLVPPANRCRALVVVITNFTAMAVAGPTNGLARFGPPIELNLGGRGIRDLGCQGTNLLIIAGPAGRVGPYGPADFKLFTWDGQPSHQPRQRSADLTGLNPEGLVELPSGTWSATNRLQLISDNGTTVFYGDDVQAKHLPLPVFKKFRSDWVTLGAAQTPSPFVLPLWRQGTNCVVSWFALEGLTYRVQLKHDLRASDWTDLPGEVLATDSIARKALTLTEPRTCFLRVTVINPPAP